MEQMKDPETGNSCLHTLNNKREQSQRVNLSPSLSFSFPPRRLLSQSTFRLAYIHTIQLHAIKNPPLLPPFPAPSPPFNASTPFVSLSYPDLVLLPWLGRVESSIALHHSNTLYYYRTYIIIIWPNQPVSSSSSLPPFLAVVILFLRTNDTLWFDLLFVCSIEDGESPLM